jgi:hypothetical protein
MKKLFKLNFNIKENSIRILSFHNNSKYSRKIGIICRINIIIFISQVVFISNSIAQDCYWSAHAGGTREDGGNVIGSDRAGNIYISGSTHSQACYFNTDTLFTGGFNQSFIAKYDVAGNEEWIIPFTGPSVGFEEGYINVGGIIDTNQNALLVCGYFYNYISMGDTVLYGNGQTIFILKMDPDGNVIWARTGDGPGQDFVFGIAYDEHGNIYISGSNENEATFSGTTIPQGGFLAKYDGEGNLVWIENKFRYFNISPFYPSFPFTEAPPFNLYYSKNKLLVNGNICNDTIIIDTITIIKNSGYVSSYLASFDTGGNIEWIRQAGGPEGACGSQFTADTSGNIFITGVFTKTGIFGNDTLTNTVAKTDCFLAKYNRNGELTWAQNLNSNHASQGSGVSSNGDGEVYLAGFFSGTACFGTDTIISGSWHDMFLSSYSSKGICKGVRQYSFGTFYHITIDRTGNIFLAGSFQNTLNIGLNAFTSYGSDDIFVAKCSEITGIGGHNPLPSNQLLIYANPNEGKCSIILPEDFRHEQHLMLSIYNNQGKLIQQNPALIIGDKISLNISAEAKGIYTAILTDGKKNYTGKIIFN